MKFDGDKFIEKHGKTIARYGNIYFIFFTGVFILTAGFIGWNFISFKKDFEQVRSPKPLSIEAEELESLTSRIDQLEDKFESYKRDQKWKFLELKKELKQDLLQKTSAFGRPLTNK